MDSRPASEWIQLFPVFGYVLGQVLVLWAVLGIATTDFQTYHGPPLAEAVMWFAWVAVPAVLPALVVGVPADACMAFEHYSAWRSLASGATTALVVLVGAGIAFWGAVQSFSFPPVTVSPEQVLGVSLGMEAALAASWGVAVLVRRFIDGTRRSAEAGR